MIQQRSLDQKTTLNLLDLIKFLEREQRRNSRYDIVIADPPSFSRITSKQSWDLIDILPRLVELLISVMADPQAALFLTSHLSEVGAFALRNILLDAMPQNRTSSKIEVVHLALNEFETQRTMLAGQLVWVGELIQFN